MARSNADEMVTEDMLAARMAAGPAPEPVVTQAPVQAPVAERVEYSEAPAGMAGAQGGGMVMSSMPGIFVDQSKFVVLASRLGRMMQPLPKRNPSDDNEETKYAVPEAFERGEVIDKKDIWVDPQGHIDNVSRLLRTGAIGRLDHPDAIGAIEGLRYRREQEELVLRDRGIIAR